MDFLNKRRIAISSLIILILLVPLIAMQFTQEVNWTVFDFIVAATLLTITGLAIDFIFEKVKFKNKRILITIIIIAILMIIWVELAVGIFNTPLGGS
ncbi:hypothetical protein [Winogradskyella forsetii]|uniref:hypothetical protein n=1 Tax=Winogradskyella forsetii TaxID=2686077 RepID=UPI0015BE9E5B|nr:hypothetical protein [Winogradskyella forsetii]